MSARDRRRVVIRRGERGSAKHHTLPQKKTADFASKHGVLDLSIDDDVYPARIGAFLSFHSIVPGGPNPRERVSLHRRDGVGKVEEARASINPPNLQHCLQ